MKDKRKFKISREIIKDLLYESIQYYNRTENLWGETEHPFVKETTNFEPKKFKYESKKPKVFRQIEDKRTMYVSTIIDPNLFKQIKYSHSKHLNLRPALDSREKFEYKLYIKNLSNKDLKIQLFEVDKNWKIQCIKEEWQRRQE